MENLLFAALKRVQESLDSLSGIDFGWAVVGGLAFSVRVEPRTTRDVDLAVAVESDEGAERLIFLLRSAGYRVLEHGHLEHRSQGRLSTVRLGGSDPGIVIDLLFASSGVEREIVDAAEPIEMAPGVSMPVARLGHLLATKLLAHRPRDIYDIEAMAEVATDEDLSIALQSLELIEQRGYNRKKNLTEIFRRYFPQ